MTSHAPRDFKAREKFFQKVEKDWQCKENEYTG